MWEELHKLTEYFKMQKSLTFFMMNAVCLFIAIDNSLFFRIRFLRITTVLQFPDVIGKAASAEKK